MFFKSLFNIVQPLYFNVRGVPPCHCREEMTGGWRARTWAMSGRGPELDKFSWGLSGLGNYKVPNVVLDVFNDCFIVIRKYYQHLFLLV